MTYLSLTSILFVSILLEEVKMFCFVSKSAWVIAPVEFAIFVSKLSPPIFKLEQSLVAQVKFVKKIILSCLLLIAELVAENLVLTFLDPIVLSTNVKFPPEDISPNVDTLFTLKADVALSVFCFSFNDVSIFTPSINNELQLICPGTIEPLEKVSLETIKELILTLELRDNISCFAFKEVSTYNLEVKWVVKVGVVFLTNT
jgi:hypothetical protein